MVPPLKAHMTSVLAVIGEWKVECGKWKVIAFHLPPVTFHYFLSCSL